MGYKLMRLGKYYDSIKTNRPFLKTESKQKLKILANILKFFKSNSTKPLVVKNKPVTIQLEPTSNCNLRCEMCVREKIGVPIGTMSFENFKIILKKLDCLFKIHLSGQGEPFLNPDIFKMIDYANKRGIFISLSTNGTLLTKNVIDKICKAEIGGIMVSVGSTKKEIFEKIRKGAKFEKVMRSIRNLTSELKRNKKKTIVSFAVTIMKQNLDEAPDFVRLAKEAGAHRVIFQTIQSKEDYVGMYDKKVKEQLIDYEEKLKEKIKEAKEIGKKFGITVVFDEQKSSGCVWPWRSMYVTWNGNVTACCKILDYRKPEMGNLLKGDFWRIWNGREYQMFRKLLRKRKAPLACKGCNMV